MVRMFLKRYGSNPVYGTFGELTVEIHKPSGQSETVFRCYTVERPWIDNKPFISCIPAGMYRVKHRMYNRGGYPALHICDVPDRSYILIHRANHMLELLGCIGVGRDFGYVYNKWAVTSSATTLKNLLKVLENKTNITLHIYWERMED